MNLQSGSQRHIYFVGFFNVPVRGQPVYTVILRNRPFNCVLRHAGDTEDINLKIVRHWFKLPCTTTVFLSNDKKISIKNSTRSGRMFSRVLHVESKHRTCAVYFIFFYFVQYRYIPICNTIQCTYKTKYRYTLYFITLELKLMCTLVSNVHVCKVIFIGLISLKPG